MHLRLADNVITLPPPARFPDTLSVAVGRTVRREVREAAASAGISPSDFLRAAIAEHLRRGADSSEAAHG